MLLPAGQQNNMARQAAAAEKKNCLLCESGDTLGPSLAWCFPVREPCFGLPCLLFGVFFGDVLYKILTATL